MDFDSLIAPLSRDEFMARYHAGTCFVVRGDREKFTDFITLDDIETALNQGCNINSPMNIVLEDGTRRPFVDNKVPWSPMASQKAASKTMIEQGHSFMMMNTSQINPKVSSLLDEVENTLAEDRLCADLHLYVSSTRDASGYNAHRDYPQHKIYLQVIGSTEWQVFDHADDLPPEMRAVVAKDEEQYLKLNTKFVLDPGDLFYMLPAVFHKVRNVGRPRGSFSISCSPAPRKQRMDRTYTPFKALFESEMAAAE